MKKRRVCRKVLQEKHRAKRRVSFTDQTSLRDFIDSKSYKALKILLNKLSPYLQNQDVSVYKTNMLCFDLDKIKKKRSYIIALFAEFLNQVESDRTLRKPKSMLFRYLSSPEHCNLGIAESSLKALISKAKQEYF